MHDSNSLRKLHGTTRHVTRMSLRHVAAVGHIHPRHAANVPRIHHGGGKVAHHRADASARAQSVLHERIKARHLGGKLRALVHARDSLTANWIRMVSDLRAATATAPPPLAPQLSHAHLALSNAPCGITHRVPPFLRGQWHHSNLSARPHPAPRHEREEQNQPRKQHDAHHVTHAITSQTPP